MEYGRIYLMFRVCTYSLRGGGPLPFLVLVPPALKGHRKHHDPEVINRTLYCMHASAACPGNRALALQST